MSPGRLAGNLYKASRLLVVLVYTLLPIFAVVMSIGLISLFRTGNLTPGLIILPLVLGFGYLFSIAALPSDIAISDWGIEGLVLGVKLKSLGWSEIKKIVKIQSKNGSVIINTYHVLGDGETVWMPSVFARRISFSDLCGIRRMGELRLELSVQSKRYGIPLFLKDNLAHSRMESNPTAINNSLITIDAL